MPVLNDDDIHNNSQILENDKQSFSSEISQIPRQKKALEAKRETPSF